MENEGVARKAITKAIENGEVATSFGVGDEQYDGYDFSEGKITYTPFRIGNTQKVLCRVHWEAEAQCVDEDYWLSPYYFEGVETFDNDGKNVKGEECDFGLRS